MAVNECVPFWDTGDVLTCHAAAGITGKRLVSISAAPDATSGNPTVVQSASATDRVFGVSAYDAAAGAELTVHHARSIIVPITAGGTIAVNDALVSDSTGRVVKAGTGVVATAGIALTAATVGQDVMVDRSIHAVGV